MPSVTRRKLDPFRDRACIQLTGMHVLSQSVQASHVERGVSGVYVHARKGGCAAPPVAKSAFSACGSAQRTAALHQRIDRVPFSRAGCYC